MPRFYAVRTSFPLALLFAGVVALVVFGVTIENTFRGVFLFAWTFIPGFVFGAAVTARCVWRDPIPNAVLFAAMFSAAVGTGGLIAAAASYWNSMGGTSSHHSVMVDGKCRGGTRSMTPFITVNWEGRQERLEVSWTVWNPIVPRQSTLNLCVRSGRLGYYYVYAIGPECAMAGIPPQARGDELARMSVSSNCN